eukprot:12114372-Heterocapsa_arctica.AAC.1
MGRYDPNPNLVLGPSDAGNGSGSTFIYGQTRVAGDGNVTWPPVFRPPPPEALTGASIGTGQVQTPFRTPPGFAVPAAPDYHRISVA